MVRLLMCASHKITRVALAIKNCSFSAHSARFLSKMLPSAKHVQARFYFVHVDVIVDLIRADAPDAVELADQKRIGVDAVA
jgi:hypothetical protein